MAKKLINFNFNGDFIRELSALKKSHSITEVNTIYCTTPTSRFSDYKTDTYLAEGIANYLGQLDTMHLFVARTSKFEYIAEYRNNSKDDTQLCIVTKNNLDEYEFKAGIITKEGLLSSFDGGHKGTLFIMALMPEIVMNAEASSFVDVLLGTDFDDDSYSRAMCGLSNNIYYRMKDDKSVAPILYSQNLKNIRQADIDNVEISKVYCGSPDVFKREVHTIEEVEKEYKEESHTEVLRNRFQLDSERVLSSEEEKRVPDLGDWYVVPEWSVKTAKRICRSRKFRKTISNILLYGPSGTGKTEGSQAIAEMLGLPYYSYTCSADDDKFDLIGQLIPNTDKKSEAEDMQKAFDRLGIPSFDDVENNFKESFEKLFGREPSKFDSEADAYKEITNRLLSEKADNENDFKYVESELIQAIKYGGFCEIQEANIIKRSSVMEALNPLLANNGDGSFIKLPSGEVIHRHPDCIIAFTINRDYEGCNDIQEAVFSRINYIKQIPEPTETELFTRTKAQTGFTNDEMLRKMAKCVSEIYEYCKEKDITGGVCGPRELVDWAQNAMLESEDNEEVMISERSVIVAAMDTVIQKVAQNEDDINDVITEVFKKSFSPSIVDSLYSK